jgi:hypothetical protein
MSLSASACCFSLCPPCLFFVVQVDGSCSAHSHTLTIFFISCKLRGAIALLTAHGQSFDVEKIDVSFCSFCHYVSNCCLNNVRPQHRNLTCFAWLSYLQVAACAIAHMLVLRRCTSWKTQQTRVVTLLKGAILRVLTPLATAISSVFSHVVGLSLGGLSIILRCRFSLTVCGVVVLHST